MIKKKEYVLNKEGGRPKLKNDSRKKNDHGKKEKKRFAEKNFGEESIGDTSDRGRARGNHYGDDDVSTQSSIVSS